MTRFRISDRGSRIGTVAMVCVAIGILGAPIAATAQQTGKVYRIGWLGGVAPTTPEAQRHSRAFDEGMRERGYIEDQNFIIERRWTGDQFERSAPLAAELVSLKVDVLIPVGNVRARAAKQVTSAIPIVMAYVLNPVEEGLVASLARPGGNVTGVTMTAGLEIVGKHLELLKEAVPKASRMAVLFNPGGPNTTVVLRETQAAARGLGVTLQFFEVRDFIELDGAFSAMTKARVGALLVLPHPFIYVHARRIAELAASHRLPAVYPFGEAVEAGGLMAYAANASDMFRRAAGYVDKILKGAKPGDLPVEQPTKFDLVVNLKTAKAMRLTIPQSVLVRADEVIQ